MKDLNKKLLEMDDILYNEWIKAVDDSDYIVSETIASIRTGLQFAIAANLGIDDTENVMKEINLAKEVAQGT